MGVLFTYEASVVTIDVVGGVMHISFVDLRCMHNPRAVLLAYKIGPALVRLRKNRALDRNADHLECQRHLLILPGIRRYTIY